MPHRELQWVECNCLSQGVARRVLHRTSQHECTHSANVNWASRRGRKCAVGFHRLPNVHRALDGQQKEYVKMKYLHSPHNI